MDTAESGGGFQARWSRQEAHSKEKPPPMTAAPVYVWRDGKVVAEKP